MYSRPGSARQTPVEARAPAGLMAQNATPEALKKRAQWPSRFSTMSRLTA